jgi:hypothetical protein
MTTTTTNSAVESMIFDEDEETSGIGNDLLQAISSYSTKKNDNDGFDPIEVTDGLRVLGTHIGSKLFC